MKVLSLYDGMACGALALQTAGIEIESYDAFEIDKYAVQTSAHNFPFLKQHGDVFKADFTQFKGVDLICGGSPCTYWSIAQKNNRETEASGMGWELFQQYVRAIREAEPKYFVYENNKSMSKQIRASIDEAFGFEAVLINSALVSAQNRQRLYWVGKRNTDGTYSRVDIEQPQDRGILLKDILERGEDLTSNNKSYALTTRCSGAIPEDTINRRRHTMVAEPVRVGTMPQLNGVLKDNQATRIYSIEGKSVTQSAQGGGWGAKTGLYAVPKGTFGITGVAEPVSVRCRGREGIAKWEARTNGKNGVVTANTVGINIAVPTSHTTDKPEYEVKNGLITIKGKQYPIKLADGFYIIRKLTVRECMRLQTVPEWYEFPVSDTQAYKMLGNGWTVDVIAHIFTHLKEVSE